MNASYSRTPHPQPFGFVCLFFVLYIHTHAHTQIIPPPHTHTHCTNKNNKTKNKKGWVCGGGQSKNCAPQNCLRALKVIGPAVTRSCVAMLRSFSDESRMKGCVITVDRSECYRFSKTPDSRQIHITCTTGVLNGRIINVSKCDPPDTSGLNYTINMCEFQVFSTLKFSFIMPLSSNFCFVFVFYCFSFSHRLR